MSVILQVTIQGVAPEFAGRLASALQNRSSLHAAMAMAAEKFVKDRGRATSATEHATANRLGGRPTNHLTRAYEAIESKSDPQGASLLIPSASRLRAAFGAYTVRPTGTRKYLTIPVHGDAYGKRAGEIPDLFFMRLGPRRTPVLARRVQAPESQDLRARTGQRRAQRRFTQAEVMYVLVKQVTQQADPGLIDFAGIQATANDTAEAWVDEIVIGGMQ